MRVYKGGRMNNFVEKVQELCEAHEKVCMFVDMDGTIVEYTVFESEAEFLKNIEIFEKVLAKGLVARYTIGALEGEHKRAQTKALRN